MESPRRIVNSLLLNVQKMELELTCPVCIKLLSAPTLLPCGHTSCSNCAAIQNKKGYGCANCKLPYNSQDLRSYPHLEAVVNIHRSISSAVSSMVAQQQESRVDIPVYKQSTGPGNKSAGDVNANDPALGNKDNDGIVEPPLKKEPCGSQSSAGPSMDYNNNDSEVELIAGKSPPQSVLKRGKRVIDNRSRETKRQKTVNQKQSATSNSEQPVIFNSEQPTTSGAWKCVFCHTSEVNEFTGPLLHSLNGKLLTNGDAWRPRTLHVHEKCVEWAPRAFFTGDHNVNNLELELARASKIKCIMCGLKGAALGCFVKSCRKNFHFPCAHGNADCRWNEERFYMYCPSHSSMSFPCEIPESKKSKPNRSKAKRSKAKNKKAQLQRPSSDTMVGDLNSPSPMDTNKLSAGSPFLTSEWVICQSALSDQEKEILGQFEHQTGIKVTNTWSSNVTHVIANMDEHGSCARTLKFLMAILAGKWVLNVNWLRACMEARKPVPEELFEISSDVRGSSGGPQMGRLRAMQKAPRLFAGLTFYFSGDFNPIYMTHFEDLIAMAGGLILDKADLSTTSLIVYNMEEKQGCENTLDEVIKKRMTEAKELAATIGCKAIPHKSILDSIASYCTDEMLM